ncbi:MAG: Protein-disulfide isomerase [Armatimonadetes bacterium OLB18]|nr:MAG: Protein-disulfide isomerase [Armatimonadetes bacterium OLB18]
MSSMKNSPILGNLCYTSFTMRGRGREHRPMSNAPEERSPSAPPPPGSELVEGQQTTAVRRRPNRKGALTLFPRGRSWTVNPRMWVGAWAWILVCIALWVAASLKILRFGLFLEYLSSVTQLSAPLLIVGALGLVAAELGLPIASLRPGWFRTCSFLAGGLFLVFATFHFVRWAIGDPLPCACFGALVPLSAAQFAAVDLGLAVAAFAAGSCLTKPQIATDKNQRSTWFALTMWTGAAALLCLTMLKVVTTATGTATTDFRRVSIDAHAFESGRAVLRQGNVPGRLIVVFGDYECPYTRSLLLSPVWAQVLADDRITVQWRELPLTNLHPRALSLACLSKRLLLRSELHTQQAELMALAESANGPLMAGFPADEVATLQDLVKQDVEIAHRLGLRATPLVLAVRDGAVVHVSDLEHALRFCTGEKT